MVSIARRMHILVDLERPMIDGWSCVYQAERKMRATANRTLRSNVFVFIVAYPSVLLRIPNRPPQFGLHSRKRAPYSEENGSDRRAPHPVIKILLEHLDIDNVSVQKPVLIEGPLKVWVLERSLCRFDQFSNPRLLVLISLCSSVQHVFCTQGQQGANFDWQ
ncbi:hypothetical protein KCU81_g308, partial [Aureobasidium melanogenum]